MAQVAFGSNPSLAPSRVEKRSRERLGGAGFQTPPAVCAPVERALARVSKRARVTGLEFCTASLASSASSLLLARGNTATNRRRFR